MEYITNFFRSLADRESANPAREFAEELALYRQMRDVIRGSIQPPRRALYIGMHTAWSHPLTIADAHLVDAVDPAYAGLRMRPQDWETFKRTPPRTVLEGEMQTYLMEQRELSGMQKKMQRCLGRIKKEVDKTDGSVNLTAQWEGYRRTYRLLPDSVEEYMDHNGGTYPIIIMHRTFPGVPAWRGILRVLERDGYLFTSGFGRERGKDIEETVSGVSSSTLPLYFSPESIGLSEVTKLEGETLFRKTGEVSDEQTGAILRAGGELDQIVYLPEVIEIVQEALRRDQDGTILEFYPRAREAIPIFWTEQLLRQHLEVILTSVSVHTTAVQRKVALATFSEQVRTDTQEVKEDRSYHDYSIRHLQQYYQAAGYIESETVKELTLSYLHRLQQAISNLHV